jgi:hypothetical protein
LDMRTGRWLLKPKTDNILFAWKRLYNDPGTDPNDRLDGCPKLGNRKDKYQYSLSRLIWIDWKEQWSRLWMRTHSSNAFSPSFPEKKGEVCRCNGLSRQEYARWIRNRLFICHCPAPQRIPWSWHSTAYFRITNQLEKPFGKTQNVGLLG